MGGGRIRMGDFRRMKTLSHRGLIAGPLVSLTTLTWGCFLPDSLSISFAEVARASRP